MARSILDSRPDPGVEARIAELAEKCKEVNLSDEERTEYADFVDGAELIAVLEAKARRVLSGWG